MAEPNAQLRGVRSNITTDPFTLSAEQAGILDTRGTVEGFAEDVANSCRFECAQSMGAGACALSLRVIREDTGECSLQAGCQGCQNAAQPARAIIELASFADKRIAALDAVEVPYVRPVEENRELSSFKVTEEITDPETGRTFQVLSLTGLQKLERGRSQLATRILNTFARFNFDTSERYKEAFVRIPGIEHKTASGEEVSFIVANRMDFLLRHAHEMEALPNFGKSATRFLEAAHAQVIAEGVVQEELSTDHIV